MSKEKLIDYLLVLPSISLYFLITEKIFSCSKSEGASMQPTIQDQSTLLIDQFLYKFRGLKKGDVVICKSPINHEINICKRIAHLENEYVSGIKIPVNHVWLEGDNKNQSFDSRHHGPIPINLIKGQVIFSFYPFGIIQNYEN